MRKIVLCLISMLYLLAGLNLVSAGSMAYLNVTLISQRPDPVEPGGYVELRFNIENSGSASAEGVKTEILAEYPFSLEPGDDAINYIGTIQSRQVGKKGVITKYRLKVDENAVEGENEIILKYKKKGWESGGWTELVPFIVDIQTEDAILAVSSVTSEPKQISPGGIGAVRINLNNMADSLLKWIKIRLDISKTVTLTTSVSTTEYPFSPIGSTNEKTLDKLEPGRSAVVEFNLIADPDAESKVYRVPLKIDYSDELGKNYSKNQIVGLIIGETPDLLVTLDSSDIKTAKSKGDITVKIVNKGSSEVKFLYMKLKDSDSYDIIGSEEVYIGNIDSDDYETANFELYVESDENEVKLPLSIEYKDANNKQYTKGIALSLKLYDKKQAKKYGIEKGNSVVGVVIVIIIVIVGLFFYLRWRKKRKK